MSVEASLLPVKGLVPEILLALAEALSVEIVPAELPVPALLFDVAADPAVLLALFEASPAVFVFVELPPAALLLVDADEPDVLAPLEVPLAVETPLEPEDRPMDKLPAPHVLGEVLVTVTVTVSGPGDRAFKI